jgi:hypothetical protein
VSTGEIIRSGHVADFLPAGDHVRIGLVGCAKTKLDHPALARSLYVSDLFKKASAYVERTYDHWFILSAQHYLVHPDEILEPYDRSMRDLDAAAKRHWAGIVECGLRCGHGARTEGRWQIPLTPRLLLGAWMSEGKKVGIERRVDLYVHAGAEYVEPLAAKVAQMRRSTWRVIAPLEGLQIGARLSWYKGALAA